MRKIQFIGISDGKIGSADLGTCEYCGDLPSDTPYFNEDGINWCQCCALSGTFNEQELKKVKANKDKEFIFPDNPSSIANIHFQTTSIEILQTYTIEKNKDKKSHILIKVDEEDYLVEEKEISIFLSEKINELDLVVDQETFRSSYGINNKKLSANKEVNKVLKKIHKEVYKEDKRKEKEAKKHENNLENLFKGKGEVSNIDELHEFLIYHFTRLKEGYPSFMKERLEEVEKHFIKNKDHVSIDMFQHEYLWGIEHYNGMIDLDFAREYEDYQWDEDLYYINEMMDEDNMESIEEFFSRINIDLIIEDPKIKFKVKS